jgi:MFS family permease
VWTVALALALALGPVTSGIVTDRWGWSWVFYLNVPFGVAALVLAFAVPGGGGARRRPAARARGAGRAGRPAPPRGPAAPPRPAAPPPAPPRR